MSVASCLLVGGGGWTKCQTTGVITTPIAPFAAKGIVAQVCTYRGANGSSVKNDQQVDDVVAAGAALRAANPTVPLFLLGASAGAQIAGRAATRLQAKGLVCWYGPTNLTIAQGGYGTGAKKATTGTSTPSQAELVRISPALSDLTVPALFQHGSADTEVPVSNSETYAANLHAAGLRADLVIYSGLTHGWANAGKTKIDEIVAYAASWILSAL